MKKTFLIAMIVILAILVSIAFVNAQGRWGAGRMGRGAGMACPRMGAGMGPGMRGMGGGMGGWWTQVQPTTKEQKTFVEQVTALHNQIRDKQIEINRLRMTNGDPKRIASLEKDAAALRTKLYEHMNKNQKLIQQLGVNPACGTRPCMQGTACAAGCKCPCTNGGVCTPGQCADCICKDNCPCACIGNPAQCATCPMKDQCQCPNKQPCTGPTCPAPRVTVPIK